MEWVKDFVQVTPFSLVVEYFMNIYFFLPNSGLGSSHQRYYMKKAVLKYSAILTEKHLCWSLFFKKVAGLYLHIYFEKYLLENL